jgi:hypothetical protein
VTRDKKACRPAMGRFAVQYEYAVSGDAGPSPDDEEVAACWR